MKILLTRPQASSARWADILSARGFAVTIEPLLTIEPTGEPRPAGDFQAVLLTSANAPDALESMRSGITDLLDLPCFCVGSSTAGAAKAIGFSNIVHGARDSAAMAKLAVDNLADKTRPLLHIAGDVVDGKARQILESAGFALQSWTIYRAAARDDLSPGCIDALRKGEIGLLPVFSPRSARVLTALIEKNRLTAACAGMTALGLSQAVGDVLQSLPWRALRIAEAPSEQEMLACLQSELAAMTDKETPALPAPPPEKKKRKPGWLWLISAILLVAAGFSFYLRPKQMSPVVLVPAPPSDIIPAQPEEARPTAAAPAADEAATLNAKIADLETQIAQLQNQPYSASLAAYAAFADLRDAARQGNPIAAPLAALNAAAKDDAFLAGQAAGLEKYKNGAPAYAQLRADLIAKEANAPAGEDTDATIGGRLQKIMRPLISLHPLHDPRFAPLEKALDANDGQAAVAAFDALPDGARQTLAAYGEQIRARAAIDQALSAIDAHFTGADHTAPDNISAKGAP